MNKKREFRPGDLVRHFKRETVDPSSRKYLYRIVDMAIHSETREKYVVYKALYDEGGVYVRPYDMFMEKGFFWVHSRSRIIGTMDGDPLVLTNYLNLSSESEIFGHNVEDVETAFYNIDVNNHGYEAFQAGIVFDGIEIRCHQIKHTAVGSQTFSHVGHIIGSAESGSLRQGRQLGQGIVRHRLC